ARAISGLAEGCAGADPIALVAASVEAALAERKRAAVGGDSRAVEALRGATEGLLTMVAELREGRPVRYDFERDIEALAWLPETEPPEPALPEPAEPMRPAGVAPATQRPAAQSARTHPVESWGPWEPAYPDMEDDYFEEVESHIDNLQSGLVQLSGGDANPDLVNDLFRSSHSIKGQSGQMNAAPLEKVAHKLEDVLDLVREGKLALTPSSAEALLGVIDALASMLGQLRETRCIRHAIGAEVEKMDRVIRGETPVSVAPLPAPASESQLSGAGEAASAPVAPSPAGTDGQARPAHLVSSSTAAKPASGAAAARSSQSKAQYLRVDFSKVDKTLNRVGDLFINKIRLDDAVTALGDLQFELSKLQNVLSRVRDGGEADVVIAREDALRLQEGLARLEAEMERTTDHLGAAMGETGMISSDLRDQVMEMRMVPVDSILGRLGRVVFDALQKENRGRGADYKRAKLEVIGADAEIDKVIANMLEVPLVHIVRNAIAHGIEPAEERVAAGKPAEGTVRIHAHQQGSRFVIETQDDGRGMDPSVIGQVAVGKGLVTATEVEQMTDKEVLGLIFRPGFTTAEKADDLKGRGVGLDEVMDKIRTIKGHVEVTSQVGKGSRVELSLPLTLAITTVVLSEIGTETLALPMSAVERVVHLDESEIESMGDAEVFTLLGQTMPLVRLDDLLGLGRPASKRPDACYVTVIQVGDKRLGLAMDRMRGQREVVIKSLGSLLKEVPLVAGSTLLGDRCVLILNPAEVAASLGRPIARAATVASAAQRGRRRALLVDDDAMTRLALRRIFEQAGLDVQEAADGAEALSVAQTAAFDIVSTDVVMPRMDGYELTRRLREIPTYQRTPILMITSKDLEVDRRAGFEAGVDHYVTKPFERGSLLDLVEEVLS
ncbi:MAG: hybrid sensor histidine kinase/response regulator, partial [Myxococcota bacterium]